jgi:class 3 adenylate cyclase
MGGGGDTGRPTDALISLAEAAAARSQWLEALDLAAQALAADPGQTSAAALVGTARQQLGSLGTAGGELRLVTVVFIDVHGSTTIAARLGPERMRQLMLEFYEVCADAVARYEGRVMRYMGDGVLSQFGYPVAHGTTRGAPRSPASPSWRASGPGRLDGRPASPSESR